MVRIGDVVMIRDPINDAESTLQTLGKLVGGAFDGSAIRGVVDVLSGLPLGTLVIELLHNSQTKRLAITCMGSASHIPDAFIQSGIAQGDCGVAIIQERVNLLTGGKTGKSAMLPEDWSHVRCGAKKMFVPQTKGAVAEFKTVFVDFPELVHVSARGESYIGEIDGDNALIPSSIVFMLAGSIVFGFCDITEALISEAIHCEETAATPNMFVKVRYAFTANERSFMSP